MTNSDAVPVLFRVQYSLGDFARMMRSPDFARRSGRQENFAPEIKHIPKQANT